MMAYCNSIYSLLTVTEPKEIQHETQSTDTSSKLKDITVVSLDTNRGTMWCSNYFDYPWYLYNYFPFSLKCVGESKKICLSKSNQLNHKIKLSSILNKSEKDLLEARTIVAKHFKLGEFLTFPKFRNTKISLSYDMLRMRDFYHKVIPPGDIKGLIKSLEEGHRWYKFVMNYEGHLFLVPYDHLRIQGKSCIDQTNSEWLTHHALGHITVTKYLTYLKLIKLLDIENIALEKIFEMPEENVPALGGGRLHVLKVIEQNGEITIYAHIKALESGHYQFPNKKQGELMVSALKLQFNIIPPPKEDSENDVSIPNLLPMATFRCRYLDLHNLGARILHSNFEWHSCCHCSWKLDPYAKQGDYQYNEKTFKFERI